MAEKLGEQVWQYAEIDGSQIPFREDVVKACEANYCGNYNRTWACPPNVGKFEDLKARYSRYRKTFVFTTKHELEDSFDIEGMNAGRLEHNRVEDQIRELAAERGAVILGAEGCAVCKTCAFPDPCRFPEKKRTSVEACGIFVVELAQLCNINYVNGENTVTYFSMVLFD